MRLCTAASASVDESETKHLFDIASLAFDRLAESRVVPRTFAGSASSRSGTSAPVWPQTDLPPEHHALSGTPEHGSDMVGRPLGSGCMITPVRCGYTMSEPHGADPKSHSTWARSGPPVLGDVVVTPHFGYSCSRLAGVEPLGAVFPA